MKRRTLISGLLVWVLILFSFSLAGIAKANPKDPLGKWKCNSERFVLPESVDPKNSEHVKKVVQANPLRFEAHLMLGGFYASRGEYKNAVIAFEKVDNLIVDAPVSEQREYEYESMYSICLAALATQRYVEGKRDVHTLRLFQRALGMNAELLKQKNRLPRIYLCMTDIYIQLGRMDRALEYAEKGKKLCRGNREFAKELIFFGKIISTIKGSRQKK